MIIKIKEMIFDLQIIILKYNKAENIFLYWHLFDEHQPISLSF